MSSREVITLMHENPMGLCQDEDGNISIIAPGVAIVLTDAETGAERMVTVLEFNAARGEIVVEPFE